LLKKLQITGSREYVGKYGIGFSVPAEISGRLAGLECTFAGLLQHLTLIESKMVSSRISLDAKAGSIGQCESIRQGRLHSAIFLPGGLEGQQGDQARSRERTRAHREAQGTAPQFPCGNSRGIAETARYADDADIIREQTDRHTGR
jgi:hypothetical protein